MATKAIETTMTRTGAPPAADLDTACETGCYGEDPCRLCRLRSQRNEARERLADARAALVAPAGNAEDEALPRSCRGLDCWERVEAGQAYCAEHAHVEIDRLREALGCANATADAAVRDRVGLELEIAALRAEVAERTRELDAAWQATGVAGQVRRLTTLDDVIACNEQDRADLRRKLEVERQESATLRAQVEASVPRWKYDEQVKQTARAEAERDRARIACGVAAAEDVWFWQGGGDRPESLACPVVMSADTLRAILADRDAARSALAECQREREASRFLAAGWKRYTRAWRRRAVRVMGAWDDEAVLSNDAIAKLVECRASLSRATERGDAMREAIRTLYVAWGAVQTADALAVMADAIRAWDARDAAGGEVARG